MVNFMTVTVFQTTQWPWHNQGTVLAFAKGD